MVQLFQLEPALALPAMSTWLTLSTPTVNVDFSQGPPIAQNPFAGAGVSTVTVTAPGLQPCPNRYLLWTCGSRCVRHRCLFLISATIVTGGSGYQVARACSLRCCINITSIGCVQRCDRNQHRHPRPATSGTLPSGVQSGTQFTTSVALDRPTPPGVLSPSRSTAPVLATPRLQLWAFTSGGATATSALGAPSAGNPTVQA